MSGRSILFVDDEPLILNGLKRMLKPLAHDWNISFASGAAEALVLLEIAPADIIATDMCMPQMNGLELLGLVKEKYPATVRVMMTGKSDYEIYRNGMEISQYFLWKPVQMSAMETLLQLLSNREISLAGESDG